jgi:hypothetical protein
MRDATDRQADAGDAVVRAEMARSGAEAARFRLALCAARLDRTRAAAEARRAGGPPPVRARLPSVH